MPGSSLYIINRDPLRSIRCGRYIFQRKLTVAQGFGPRTGDGLGNISAGGSIGVSLSDSCVGCHGRPRGSAGFGANVLTRRGSRDARNLFGLGIIEMLADEITQDLRQTRDQTIARAQARQRAVEVSLKSKDIF